MFSGIVEEAAKVVAVEEVSHGRQLEVLSGIDHANSKEGDSICIDGVCLTIVEIQRVTEPSLGWKLRFDVASETLRCTTLGDVGIGHLVHFERSLAIGDRIHGHIVSGHVDETCAVASIAQEGETTKVTLSLSKPTSLIAQKGSITLAGVSLTVGDVSEKEFQVYLIPHTKEVTHFGRLEVGQKVNVEFDMLARYVARQLSSQQHGEGQ